VTRYIDAHRERFGVEPICQTLQVATSTYYAVKSRRPSRRSLRDAELTAEIRRVHARNFGVYGVEKVWRQLNREGVTVGRDRVARLMADLGLAGAVRGKRVRTTLPNDAGARHSRATPTGHR
jgi:putative transposase